MVAGWSLRRGVLAAIAFLMALVVGASNSQVGGCGPFSDVNNTIFCPFVLEIFYLGITTGVTPTTYNPDGDVSRIQMAAFLSRTVDATLKRGSRRVLLRKFYTPQSASAMGVTTFGTSEPTEVACDGRDVWVSGPTEGKIWRVRGSDGRILDTWTGALQPLGLTAVNGQVVAVGATIPGFLFRIEASKPAGAVTTVATNVGQHPNDIVSDGSRFWTSNDDGTFSIVTPQPTIPWTVTTVTTGESRLYGALYDGANIWVRGIGVLLKLDSGGTVLQTVTVGSGKAFPVSDGTNIWSPDDNSNSLTVVRASSGAVVATLTGNGLDGSNVAAFDGERVLVTNGTGPGVSLWRASDLSPLGSVPTGGSPAGACSDGFQFWIATVNGNSLLRF